MNATVVDMPIGAFAIPKRNSSKPRNKRRSKQQLIVTVPKPELRPLPAGWVRQYDIIHKRYFYVDIRDKEAPKSTWRFPPGEPISEEMSILIQSVDIHRYNAPSSAPPPATRKITPAPVVKKDIEIIKIQAKEPIVVHSDPNDLDLTYAKFLQQMHAGESPILGSVDLSSSVEDKSKRKPPNRPRRKPVPEYSPNLVQSEFIKQLSDLDLESSEAADILLKLAFPDIIMDLSDADYESLEEKSNSSSSASSSSGHSSADSNSSAWTLDL